MVRQDLVRGQMLVAQGGPSDALFLVLHGALAVRKTGYSEPIAELRAGELVGEIGFFANGPRTADVIAIRDTSVLALTRPAYQKLVEEAPAIVEALLAALARRFAKETARIAPFPSSPKARTVALIDGGVRAAAGGLRSPDARGARRDRSRDYRSPPACRRCFPAARSMRTKSPNGSTGSNTPRRWWSISAAAKPRPGRARPSVRPTWWCSRAAARRPPPALTEIEAFACEVHSVSARRLVRVHDHRSGEVCGTAAWLARLPAFHASPCRARRPDRYRQPGPLSVRPGDRLRRRRRRQFRHRACRHLQGVSRTRRDVRYLCRHQRRLRHGGRLCQELSRPSISSAARTRSSSRAEAFGGRPGRAIRCWITRRSIARWPINTAPNAGSRIAGGRSRRSRPIFRPTISN